MQTCFPKRRLQRDVLEGRCEQNNRTKLHAGTKESLKYEDIEDGEESCDMK